LQNAGKNKKGGVATVAGGSKRAVFYGNIRYQFLDHTIIVLRARNGYGKSILARKGRLSL
jgi:hypothetical protein